MSSVCISREYSGLLDLTFTRLLFVGFLSSTGGSWLSEELKWESEKSSSSRSSSSMTIRLLSFYPSYLFELRLILYRVPELLFEIFDFKPLFMKLIFELLLVYLSGYILSVLLWSTETFGEDDLFYTTLRRMLGLR